MEEIASSELVPPHMSVCLDLLAAGKVPRRRLGPKARKELVSLIDSGTIEQAQSGAGFAWHLRDREALERFVKTKFAHALTSRTAVTAGAANLLKFGHTKGGRREGQTEGLLLRASTPCFARINGELVDLFELSVKCGCAATPIYPGVETRIDGPLLLVENPEVFWHWASDTEQTPVRAWKSGRASNVLLDWLASEPMSDVPIVLAVDYDPVGLDEYSRFCDRLGQGRVTLYLPENLEELFKNYSAAGLLTKSGSLAIFEGPRYSERPKVQRVVGLILKYHGGLEHEALLLK